MHFKTLFFILNTMIYAQVDDKYPDDRNTLNDDPVKNDDHNHSTTTVNEHTYPTYVPTSTPTSDDKLTNSAMMKKMSFEMLFGIFVANFL